MSMFEGKGNMVVGEDGLSEALTAAQSVDELNALRRPDCRGPAVILSVTLSLCLCVKALTLAQSVCLISLC